MNLLRTFLQRNLKFDKVERETVKTVASPKNIDSINRSGDSLLKFYNIPHCIPRLATISSFSSRERLYRTRTRAKFPFRVDLQDYNVRKILNTDRISTVSNVTRRETVKNCSTFSLLDATAYDGMCSAACILHEGNKRAESYRRKRRRAVVRVRVS